MTNLRQEHQLNIESILRTFERERENFLQSNLDYPLDPKILEGPLFPRPLNSNLNRINETYRSNPKEIEKPKVEKPKPFKFKRTFLQDFFENNEPVIYLKGNLYALGEEVSEGGEVIFNKKMFKLNPLEDILTLERQLISNHYDELKDYQKACLKFYSKKGFSENIDDLVEDRSLENFINYSLIPIHLGQDQERAVNFRKKEDKEFSLKDIGFINRTPILESLMNQINYELPSTEGFILDKNNIRFIKKGFFKHLFNYPYNLDKNLKFKSKDDFEKKYVDGLSRVIRNSIENDIREALKNSVEIIPKKSKKVPGSSGSLNFKKNSENEYVVFKQTGRFIIESQKKYYNFRSTNVGMLLFSIGTKLDCSGKPFIYDDASFKHPFVPSGPSKIKDICFGAGNSASYRETNWKTNGKNKYVQLANRILDNLRRADNLLKCGYTIDNSNGVYRNISSSSGKKISRSKALELEREGIPIFYGGKNE